MVNALTIYDDLPVPLQRGLSIPNKWGYSKKDQFLTLTFDDRWTHKTMKALFRATIFDLMKNLQQISPNEYKIFPELSKIGTLHYHILIYHLNFLKLSKFLGYWRRRYGKYGTDLRDVKPGTLFSLYMYCRKVNKQMAGKKYLALKYIRNAIITNSSLRVLRYHFECERIARTNKNILHEQLDTHLLKLLAPPTAQGSSEPTFARKAERSEPLAGERVVEQAESRERNAAAGGGDRSNTLDWLPFIEDDTIDLEDMVELYFKTHS